MALHHRFLEGLYLPAKVVRTAGRSLGVVSGNSLRVLIYHDIGAREQPRFIAQLRWLKRSWRFVSPEQFAAMICGGEPVSGRSLLLTFDDGSASQRRIAEEVLSPMGIRALFFVVSDLVSDRIAEAAPASVDGHSRRSAAQGHQGHLTHMTWPDLEALLEQGHHIGAHTATHARLSGIQAETDLEREIIASADALAGRLGVSIEHFAYPFGDLASFSPRALAVARRRFRFIHTGLRGDNAHNASASRLWRDAATPQDSRALLGAYLEGAADFHYGRSRAELVRWVATEPGELRQRARARQPARGAAAAGSAAARAGEPSLKSLQLALEKTTEALATELRRPTASAPDWSPVEWSVARAVASIHGVSPLLATALRWPGPACWAQFLAQQKVHTARRFDRIHQLLQLIDGGARRNEIALVALKGAALHAIGVYAAGERPMADVDLMVRDAESARATQLLVELGFHPLLRDRRSTTFQQAAAAAPAALGEHAGNAIQIDLHFRIDERLPLRAVDISEIVFPAQPHPGLNGYASKAALLMHLLLHAARALSGRALRLLQLHDIARLAHSMTDAEWEQVFHEAERLAEAGEQSLWWAFPPLELAARYCDGVPERLLTRTATHCNWLLKRAYKHKRLSSASLSYLWISAFPGIEWTRSPREMLQYAATRIAPSAATVQQRTTLASVQPRVSGGSWSDLSQTRRVLRWVMSRQARHETLQPVSAALRAP